MNRFLKNPDRHFLFGRDLFIGARPDRVGLHPISSCAVTFYIMLADVTCMTTDRLELRYMDPHDLVPCEDNPRLNDDAVPMVQNSIEDYGNNDPIEVTEDLVVLSGHTRLRAALERGDIEVPVIVNHDPVLNSDPDRAMGYRIAANKTQEKAGWDFPKLDPIVTDLTMKGIDLSRIGLDMSYMEDMEIPDPIEIPEPSDGGKPLYPDEGDYVRFGDDALYVAERDDWDLPAIVRALNNEYVPKPLVIVLMKLFRDEFGMDSCEVS